MHYIPLLLHYISYYPHQLHLPSNVLQIKESKTKKGTDLHSSGQKNEDNQYDENISKNRYLGRAGRGMTGFYT